MREAVNTPPRSASSRATSRPRSFVTRGHDEAAAHLAQLLGDSPPHALLIVGPRGAGVGTLARDAVATLLCLAPSDGGPCGACRSCRLIASGSHADLVRIEPTGASDQIGIEPIRALELSLSLYAVEGGRRVALIERADRLNEAAQNALLKTLEEPPARTHIILAAAEDSALMPTIRSRCATLRIGLPNPAAAAELLAERLGLDAPTATRLLRMAAGRPGPLIDAGATGEAARAHAQLRRQILDLVAVAPHARLALLPTLIADARAILVADDGGTESDDRATLTNDDDDAADAEAADTAASPVAAKAKRTSAKPSPAERRAAAAALLRLWRGVARDLACVASGASASVAFPEDLSELKQVAERTTAATWTTALRRVERALSALRSNGNPELLLDALALRWPRV